MVAEMEKVSLFEKKKVLPLLQGSHHIYYHSFTSEDQRSTSYVKKRSVHENREDASSCLTCSFSPSSRVDQRDHYKSDWHRYNLKLKLNGCSAVTQGEFEDVINEISSISGSDSDNECVNDIAPKEDITRIQKALNAVSVSENNADDETSSITARETSRTPKIYLKSSAGMQLSFYRSIIPFKDSHIDRDRDHIDILELQRDIVQEVKCLVILFSAGHFAACVFDNEVVTVHKTFHRYVLRAKQGTVQSVRDNKGNAPKSGGAALRRHNEAALAADIQDLLNSWKNDHIDKCSHIFLRAPHYGKGTFYNGKSAPLQRKDNRIKGIPFPTRRPTFNELKRVYKELFSITVAKENDTEKIHKEHENNEDCSANINVKQKVVNPVGLHLESNEMCDSKNECMDDHKSSDTAKGTRRRKHKKKEIDYVETLPSQNPEVTTESPDLEVGEEKDANIVDELFTVCKVGNLIGLKAILATLETEYAGNTILKEDILSTHLNLPVTSAKDTLLHIAAKCGHQTLIHFLLEHGADPANKNDQSLVPYQVSSDKPARNVFRKFMAQFPNKYDYRTAQVPGPLTENMENERKQKQQEKKKAQKAQKKEKLKEQKAVKQKLNAEQQEKERFAALSDREKRAVAAERRLAQQLSAQGASSKRDLPRCWLCGESLLGKIPFEYYDYKFCSISCLKKHKSVQEMSR